jgi:hypothetical protein
MLNVNGIQALLISIAGLAIILIGIRIIGSAKKASFSETANTSMNTIIGITFVAIGAGAVAVVALGSDVAKTIFG